MITTKTAKWLGLIGAIFAGGSAIAAGDSTTGWGIIAAAMSSVTVLRSQA